MATRGDCSPDVRASPGTSFTRTGAPKVAPPSPLNAAYTSVADPVRAAQVTTTDEPAAATEAPLFTAPGAPSATGGGAQPRSGVSPQGPSDGIHFRREPPDGVAGRVGRAAGGGRGGHARGAGQGAEEHQKLSRRPSCTARASPTAVIWRNVGEGFVG